MGKCLPLSEMTSDDQRSTTTPYNDTVDMTAKDRRQAEKVWKRVTRGEQKLKLISNLREIGVGTRRVEKFKKDLNEDTLTRSGPGVSFTLSTLNKGTD